MCLHSCPRAGNAIRLKVMGHLSDTLMAVCSTPSPSAFNPPGLLLDEPDGLLAAAAAATLLKLRLILAMQ